MQVVLNKNQKHQLVIELHQQGKTMREIAQQVHMSFGDIGKIIRKIDGLDDNIDANDLSSKSKSTRAIYLFSNGKTPIDVAIELDLPATEVHDLQQEFWSLNELHELVFIYDEIKYYLPSFLKLFNLLKRNKLLGEERITKFLKYADHDLPSLENKIQNLTGYVIDLEWKKKDLNNTISLWSAQLADLGRTIVQYQNAIDNKKQKLMRMDK